MSLDPIQQAIQFQNVQKAAQVKQAPVQQKPVKAETENKDENQLSEQQRIKSAVKHANSQMKHSQTRCEFSYNEPTKRISIKVIDEDTDEVIKEIPPEETLEMIEKMWELAGILVDERR